MLGGVKMGKSCQRQCPQGDMETTENITEKLPNGARRTTIFRNCRKVTDLERQFNQL